PNNAWPDGTAAYGPWAYGTGGVAIGSWTDMPAGQLYVTGSIGVATSSPGSSYGGSASGPHNPLIDVIGAEGDYGYLPHYQNWAAYGTGDGGAAIYNDPNTYKTLMLVGNNSKGGERRVSVWDSLEVNGQIISTDASCAEVQYSIDGVTTCAAAGYGGATYVTSQSGLISYLTIMPIYTNGVGATQGGTAPMLCCACPASGCPL
ncbi:MAG TPA: hypothetical protein VH309_04270, partial [Elusimicrobiota bacterium]|nr:hypothetical protein [Elusimicrobiota bacterium]